MAYEEKRAWIMLVVSAAAYVIYLVITLGRAGPVPLADVAYAATMLGTIVGAILAAIVLGILVAITAPKEAGRRDQRDRDIGRFGDHIGQSFVVIGGVAAMLMAMAELSHFWIANVIYLMFVLSAVLGSVAKIFAYRRGYHAW